jgi:Catalytic LigB subunit of aromatic ring-opening dioxygenase
MIVYPAKRLLPRLDVPIIPLYLNCYFPPLPTAARCWQLGEALARILATRKERVAIYASGGLSHDPVGPRAGWIDTPMDKWILDRIATNRGRDLQHLFTMDSATMRGGSGEIRAWIVAAAACQWKGEIVDYIPAHHAKTGLGFAYWPQQPKE